MANLPDNVTIEFNTKRRSPLSYEGAEPGDSRASAGEPQTRQLAEPQPSCTSQSTPIDPVNNPSYYVFPNGAEVIHLSQWLTSAGGQAVQYIARATRIDGVVKGRPIEDLEKARFWIDVEIERLKGTGA